MKRISSAEGLETERKRILSARDPNKPCITVCTGTGCHAAGCYPVAEAFTEVLKKNGIDSLVSPAGGDTTRCSVALR